VSDRKIFKSQLLKNKVDYLPLFSQNEFEGFSTNVHQIHSCLHRQFSVDRTSLNYG